MLFLFVCLFVFSKISFLHGAVFILYWELAFFGLNVFFYSVILYISHKNTKTNIHTHTHTPTHPHAHIHITLWEPNCVRYRNSYVCCLVTMSNNWENMYNAVMFLCFMLFRYNWWHSAHYSTDDKHDQQLMLHLLQSAYRVLWSRWSSSFKEESSGNIGKCFTNMPRFDQ